MYFQWRQINPKRGILTLSHGSGAEHTTLSIVLASAEAAVDLQLMIERSESDAREEGARAMAATIRRMLPEEDKGADEALAPLDYQAAIKMIAD